MNPLMQGIRTSWEASVIEDLKCIGIVGLKWTDVFVFASQLPRLLVFSFEPFGEWSEKDLPSATALHQLQRLYLHRSLCDITAFIMQSVPTSVFELRLFELQLDRRLVQSLALAHTHSLQYVCISECTQIESDHVFHLIMCTLQALRSFEAFRLPMVCDPRILQQMPWVCRNLQEFHVDPKCNSSSEYSPLEAQQAFMTQVGSLTRLTKLHLASSKFDGVANGFKPETSWRLLRNMTELQKVDIGFSPERN